MLEIILIATALVLTWLIAFRRGVLHERRQWHAKVILALHPLQQRIGGLCTKIGWLHSGLTDIEHLLQKSQPIGLTGRAILEIATRSLCESNKVKE